MGKNSSQVYMGDVEVDAEQVAVKDATVSAKAMAVDAEEVKIEDSEIKTDRECVFSGKILLVGDLEINGPVVFDGDVAIASGARLVINGRTVVPKPED